jgi:hypoxanthine phosphoribosyltransferase
MHQDLKTVLITEEEIQAAAQRLAAQIDADYAGEEIVFVGLLKGSVQFMADLLKHVQSKCRIDFMCVSSYGSGTKSTGRVNIIKDLSEPINDKNVVIVEDIIDSGHTLSFINKYFAAKQAKSVRICTLLNKPSRREVEIDVDYVGFEVPDEFVVGYGLDYQEYYRNLPYIGVLKPEIYE